MRSRMCEVCEKIFKGRYYNKENGMFIDICSEKCYNLIPEIEEDY